MYERHEIGKEGEDIAVKYLESKGYKIVERNFEAKQGEIDIIAMEKNELVVIQVKTRTNIKYGLAVEAVTENKQKHLIKAIKYYIYKRNIEDAFIRIDVIEVYLKKNKYYINHIKQAIDDCSM